MTLQGADKQNARKKTLKTTKEKENKQTKSAAQFGSNLLLAASSFQVSLALVSAMAAKPSSVQAVKAVSLEQYKIWLQKGADSVVKKKKKK